MPRIYILLVTLLILSGCTLDSNKSKDKTLRFNKSNWPTATYPLRDPPVDVSDRKTKIGGVEAIKMAEQFIIEQGYTDAKPDQSYHLILMEAGESASDSTRILKDRLNTVKRKAIGAKEHGNSWTVGFMYVNEEENIGRAVTMDTLGTNIIMQANPLRLDWLIDIDESKHDE